jgi:hypothetical protein
MALGSFMSKLLAARRFARGLRGTTNESGERPLTPPRIALGKVRTLPLPAAPSKLSDRSGRFFSGRRPPRTDAEKAAASRQRPAPDRLYAAVPHSISSQVLVIVDSHCTLSAPRRGQPEQQARRAHQQHHARDVKRRDHRHSQLQHPGRNGHFGHATWRHGQHGRRRMRGHDPRQQHRKECRQCHAQHDGDRHGKKKARRSRQKIALEPRSQRASN